MFGGLQFESKQFLLGVFRINLDIIRTERFEWWLWTFWGLSTWSLVLEQRRWNEALVQSYMVLRGHSINTIWSSCSQTGFWECKILRNCKHRWIISMNYSMIHLSIGCVWYMQAVIKRLMTDVPFGVLLSGGLDSSLVASITARHLAGTKAAKQWGAQLHSFCVGLEVSCEISSFELHSG